METVCNQNMCAGCMACLDICPKKAINIVDSVIANNAVIDTNRCVHCGLCYSVCPNKKPVEKYNPIEWYEGWTTSPMRKFASSGGMASALIRLFIEHGGYVAACMFQNGKFGFQLTNDLSEASQFAGSKYVKSNPAGIYEQINSKLKAGNRVLFIGLPCQVAALKNFVKTQDLLYTVDLICHGSPSPKILEAFLREKGMDITCVESIQFRQKASFGLRVGDRTLGLADVMDWYTYAFLTALDYTENCYSCTYANLGRVADITLGDSWGSTLDESEQKKGVSLILCQTEKGRELLHNAELTLQPVDLEKAVAANAQLKSPSQMPKNRKKFLDNIQYGFDKAMAKSDPKVYYKKKLKAMLVRMKGIKKCLLIKPIL